MSIFKLKESAIVVVASSKGGVGKSVTAVNLAVDAADAGLTVGLYDAEKNGTTIDWSDVENENLTVLNGYEKSFPAMLSKYKKMFDLIVVDTAGVNADMDDNRDNLQEYITQKVLCQADMVVIPLEPSPTAIRKTLRYIPQIENYIDASRGKMKALMFLNQAKANEDLTKSVLELVENDTFSLPFSKTTIRQTTAIRKAEAAFESINQYAPNHPAAIEMKELQKEIFDTLRELQK